MSNPDIVFPHLGIEFQTIDPIAFYLFGLPVYWYGIIIVTGVILGLLLARYRAKKNGEDPEIYSDFLMYALIGAIIGARTYYVVFAWDQYKDNLLDIFNTREGGLAIYGGVIGATIALAIYTKVKKLNFLKMADTAAPGLVVGQIIGRMGNFMNMEAFGGPTNGLFAMALKAEKAKIPSSMVQYISTLDGYQGNYLIVQPTFAYEAVWNIGVLIVLLVYTRHKKFNGEILAMYFLCYGLGRAWIEGLRTDQLIIGHTGIPVSQVLSMVLAVISFFVIIWFRKKNKNLPIEAQITTSEKEDILELAPDENNEKKDVEVNEEPLDTKKDEPKVGVEAEVEAKQEETYVEEIKETIEEETEENKEKDKNQDKDQDLNNEMMTQGKKDNFDKS